MLAQLIWHLRHVPFVAMYAMIAFGNTGCDTSSPTSPVGPPPATADTCRNKAPLPPNDSALYNWPPFVYSVYNVFRSPAGLLAGRSFVYGMNGLYSQQSFVFDPVANHVVGIFQGQARGWSNDGLQLLSVDGWNGISIVNASTGGRKVISTMVSVEAHWSPDNQWIYFSRNGDAYRIRTTGEDTEFLAERMSGAAPIDDTRIIAISDSGFVVYDRSSRKRTFLDFSRPVFPSHFAEKTSSWALSPDRTKILADLTTGDVYKNVNRDGVGLYLYDLQAQTVRLVLPGQYWYNRYNARWTSNKTFFASYFCRCDSTEMVYEYNLDGRVLGQITYKDTKLFP